MLKPDTFLRQLQDHGVTFFAGVPDSLLKEICACIAENVAPAQHVIAANEGGAIALGLGYYLATGQLPLVYMQNSGLGNAINPLLSLADPETYAIPMLLLIGWRGEPGIKDEPQHAKQGKVTLSLLDAMGIPYSVLDGTMDDSEVVIAEAVSAAKELAAPYALVVRKGVFEAYPQQAHQGELPLRREDAIKLLVDALTDRDIVISTTGMASRELFETRERLDGGHHRDFLTIGGMGHASQIALAIAMQKPERQVYCLDGDGAALMHMGALAINGASKCQNFKHILINNASHDSVGGQPTVGGQVDLVSTARAMGYHHAASSRSGADFSEQLRALREAAGPALLEVHVEKGARPDLGRPTIPPQDNKRHFMDFLNL